MNHCQYKERERVLLAMLDEHRQQSVGSVQVIAQPGDPDLRRTCACLCEVFPSLPGHQVLMNGPGTCERDWEAEYHVEGNLHVWVTDESKRVVECGNDYVLVKFGVGSRVAASNLLYTLRREGIGFCAWTPSSSIFCRQIHADKIQRYIDYWLADSPLYNPDSVATEYSLDAPPDL